eukprot:CAMPEP_0176416626 /NCGR_PEP_ID=MMETSP0127-20121128/6448_1 /TAXON_ID=938130 /ORGANISM="Platyophrya macrostoma, Strain WH" /LENGTH=216 /DNA_ID=CAMNT_0017796717 /DNA_START=76 /DNA_END=726 /DNA_ORIENTATION=+
MSVILHTSEGDLMVQLHYEACPKASFNFLALCASQYYDGTMFHRNIPSALIQGGDPTGTGKGGESIYMKFRDATHSNQRSHEQPGETATPSSSAGSSHTESVSSKYFEDEGFGVTSHSTRGVISMAHKGKKDNSNASQFFILYGPQPSFDGVYTAFGEAVGDASRQTLDRLEERGRQQQQQQQKGIPLVEAPRILSCEVTRNPFATNEFRFDPSKV